MPLRESLGAKSREIKTEQRSPSPRGERERERLQKWINEVGASCEYGFL